jgi:hypothetical protein
MARNRTTTLVSAIILLACGLAVPSSPARAQSAPAPQAADQAPESKLAFSSSDTKLVDSFNWAKKQAMAYVQPGTDPVGLWYETGLPGRTRFSMRDTSHQVMGAQALGLAAYNLNMLRHFAAGISDSRDWCSYWGIDRWGRPASVDNKSDAQFWYCLPANFDDLDAMYRMFLWTGDQTYMNDPVFLNFYDRTVNDYVTRWDLDPEHIMSRKRWLNVRGEFDPTVSLQTARGIPGYAENPRDYVVGIDLLVTEYLAFRDYAYIQQYRGNDDSAQIFLKKAGEVLNLINTTWWDDEAHQYYAQLDKDYKMQGQGGGALLYWGVADDGPKGQSAVSALVDNIQQHPGGQVEGASHFAEDLYRYGAPDTAYAEIMDLTTPGRNRQEYPEVSYSVISAMVNGLMGINLEAPPPLEAYNVGNNFTEITIKTLPALSKQTAWAELRNLPIRSNEVSVRHDGLGKTTFTNEIGPSLYWKAELPGKYDTLLVNGKPMKASPGEEPIGRVTSWVKIIVGAGDSITIQTPPPTNPDLQKGH